MRRPHVQTPLPGPRALSIIERDRRALMTSTKTAPVVARKAEGVWVEDVDGNTLLDFTSGISVVNTGFSHPKILEAIERQSKRLIHYAGTDFYYEEQVALAERLISLTPGSFPKKVFFTNSGTESNEAAIKVARHRTGRPFFLAFLGAFHGRTMGSLSLSASKVVHRRGFSPTLPGVFHVPYPNPYRNPWRIDGYAHPDELVARVLDEIELLFETVAPAEEVAAVFVEPIQGEGGYVVPPPNFLPSLRKLADERGILLALDEVQTGFGRTGKMFASEHWGVFGDLLSLAKGIASGIPMGALVARADLDFPVAGAHSNTFGGNALASAAALSTLEVLEKEGLVENASRVGEHLRKRLREIQEKDPRIGDVRGLGLMVAAEIVRDPREKTPDAATRDLLLREALREGLVLLPCGRSSIRFIPPLSITREEVDVGVEIFERALRALRS